MDRRSLLAMAVAGIGTIAGLGVRPHSAEHGRSLTTSIETDPVPREFGIAVDAEVVRQCSEESPARIQLRLTKTSSDERRYILGPTPPFSDYTPISSEGPFLLPDSRTHLLRPAASENSAGASTGGQRDSLVVRGDDGCWRLESSVASSHGTRFLELETGEELRETYSVVAPSRSRCLKPGSYRFEAEQYLGLGFDWGFDLVLES